MKLMWGDFARGFTGSLREDYRRTRERNERVIDAGINRAIERGTKLYDKRKGRDKEYLERIGMLERNNIGVTINQRAALASQSTAEWEHFWEGTQEFFSDYANDFKAYNKLLFETSPDYDEGIRQRAEGVKIKAEDIMQKITGTPSLTNALTPQDQTQVQNTYRDAFAQAGIISATPSWLREQALGQAAGMMPEVGSPEELRKLLAQEGDRPPTDFGGVVSRLPGSKEYMVNIQYKEAQIDNQKVQAELARMDITERKAVISNFRQQQFEEGGTIYKYFASLDQDIPAEFNPDMMTNIEFARLQDDITLDLERQAQGLGHSAVTVGQSLQLTGQLKLTLGQYAVQDATDENSRLTLNEIVNASERMRVINQAAAIIGEATPPLFRLPRKDETLAVDRVALAGRINDAAMAPAIVVTVLNRFTNNPALQKLRNSEWITAGSLLRAGLSLEQVLSVMDPDEEAGLRDDITLRTDDLDTTIDEGQQINLEKSQHFLNYKAEHLAPGMVKFDVSNLTAALTTYGLFFNTKLSEAGEEAVWGIDELFSVEKSGLNPTTTLVDDLKRYLHHVMTGAIPAKGDGSIRNITDEDVVNFFRQDGWETSEHWEIYDAFKAIVSYRDEGFQEQEIIPLGGVQGPEIGPPVAVAPAAVATEQPIPEVLVDATTVPPVVIDGTPAPEVILSTLSRRLSGGDQIPLNTSNFINSASGQTESGIHLNYDWVSNVLTPVLGDIFKVTNFGVEQRRQLAGAQTVWTNLIDTGIEHPNQYTTDIFAPSQLIIKDASKLPDAVEDWMLPRTRTILKSLIDEEGNLTEAGLEEFGDGLSAVDLSEKFSDVYAMQPALTEEGLANVVATVRERLSSTFKIENGKLVFAREGAMLTTNEDGKPAVLTYEKGANVFGTGLVNRPAPLPFRQLLQSLGSLVGESNKYLVNEETLIPLLKPWLM